MNTVRSIAANLKLMFVLLVLAVVPATSMTLNTGTVYAQSSVACEGLDDNGGFCSSSNATPEVSGILATAINILSVIAGVAATIMFILGGTKYITSQGDANSTKSAKNTLLYAAIGLVIVVVSQTLVFFFIDQSADLPYTPPASSGSGPR